ncbi:efflux RND transporter periplasmic adaptor subunit [Halosquirtibacter laminarini]|uniref:Efflux RND transporter periplasmic adaptor subunit n=1 Tax=Halosquirtibacter laminarini TaxID=3374600 RepID=A0AC61NFN7_9BACT|nr:efflux RND transporter periplasmic adaptor subunit [Prolixibacteraceae bacterium]
MRRVQLFGLVISILFISITSCSKKQKKSTTPPSIYVTSVKQQSIPDQLEFVGQTYGYKDIEIRARVDGFLEGIYFKEGSKVKKGQLLYRVEPRQLKAKLNQAQSQLAVAKANLINARNFYDRVAPLAEIDALSQKDLDQATANKDAAIAQVKVAQASVHYAKIELEYTQISAPISGIIGKTAAKVGDYVGRSPNPIVLNEISEIDSILVDFYLPETRYLQLIEKAKKRDNKYINTTKFQMILADGSTYPLMGRLNFIDRNVDPKTGSIRIQVVFPNTDLVLRPGQYAKIRAILGEITSALMIPQKAVFEIQGGFSVFIVKEDNTLQFKKVSVGEKFGDLWHITKGLDKNDRVVSEGLLMVKNGMKITPLKR